MDIRTDDEFPPIRVRRPARQTVPLVVSSPHSGTRYPQAFLETSRLPLATLRRSEDSFVDELFAAAPDLGAPFIEALFPRSWLDVNREPFEFDPTMFADPLPRYVNSRSARVRSGLGTIPRIAATGAEIYRGKLPWSEARARLRGFYLPYQRGLNTLVSETRRHFGYAVLLDCHSMPSAAAESATGRQADIVLGDCHGASCAAAIVDGVESCLRRMGYATLRNRPYAGGYTTQSRGRPLDGVHALQIEINRAIYMNEEKLLPRPSLGRLAADMTRMMAEIARIEPLPLAAE